METIELDDLKLVNTFDRLDLMKAKTQDLVQYVAAFSDPNESAWFMRELAEYGNLAIDWANGGEIDWDDSLPDQKAKRILAAVDAKQKENILAASHS